MPKTFQRALWLAATTTVLFFAFFWGAQFKRVYLDPWPVDGKYDSVFMRMTASNVKPTDVGRFIKENKLSGTMFNYWTEGGAIAFAQEPDPVTGRTPLQLFMDGRAQAAYDHDKFLLWNTIKSGGPEFQRARLARRKLTNDDYDKIGKWINQQMKERNVWVILMPINELNSVFVKGLQKSINWVTVYTDSYQRMWVDIEYPEGKTLLNNVLSQKARFPNELARNLTLGSTLIKVADTRAVQVGYEHITKAFQLRPSQISAMELIYASRRKELNKAVTSDLRQYVEQFINKKDELSKEGDYEKKLVAAIIAGKYLAGHLRRTNPGISKRYADISVEYEREREIISNQSRW